MKALGVRLEYALDVISVDHMEALPAVYTDVNLSS